MALFAFFSKAENKENRKSKKARKSKKQGKGGAGCVGQRLRDDNKIKLFTSEGGGCGGREENCPKTLFF